MRRRHHSRRRKNGKARGCYRHRRARGKGERKALQNLAKENGLFVVDGISLSPHISDFFADQILHPNDLGFGFYAENLLKALKKEDLI